MFSLLFMNNVSTVRMSQNGSVERCKVAHQTGARSGNHSHFMCNGSVFSFDRRLLEFSITVRDGQKTALKAANHTV